MNKINKLLVLIMFIGSTYVGYDDIANGNIYSLLITMSIVLVVFVPKILRKLFKLKISRESENIYITFIFFSHFLGSIVNLYDNIYWYDTFAHLLSGIICSFFILELLIRIGKYDGKSVIFNILFIMGISFMLASSWEFFEFITDKIFNADAQKVLETGVDDTMKDMMVAALGALLFCITYAFRKDEHGYIQNFIEDIK